MGWLFGWNSKKELANHLKKNWSCPVLKASTVGNNLWFLIETRKGKMIALAKMACDKGQWGYKDLDETMGLYETNCPISFIKKADKPFNEHAREWRHQVICNHEHKKQKKELAAGDTVALYGYDYILMENRGRKGWIVEQVGSFKIYKMNCQLINKSELVAKSKY